MIKYKIHYSDDFFKHDFMITDQICIMLYTFRNLYNIFIYLRYLNYIVMHEILKFLFIKLQN